MLMTQLCTDTNFIGGDNIPQQDLGTLSQWWTTWLVDFNVCKCAIFSTIKKRDTTIKNWSKTDNCYTVFCLNVPNKS